MKNINNDLFAKEMMQNSRLEITNANFDKIVMQKIQAESRRHNLISHSILYLVIFISIDSILFVILKLMHINITACGSGLTLIIHKTLFFMKETSTSVMENSVVICFFTTVILFSALLKMIAANISHPQIHSK